MIVSGIVLIVSPMIGMVGTVFGMVGTFKEMSKTSAPGISDPQVLSEKVGEVLISTAAGLMIAVLSLPVFVIFLVLMVRENRRIERMLAAPAE